MGKYVEGVDAVGDHTPQVCIAEQHISTSHREEEGETTEMSGWIMVAGNDEKLLRLCSAGIVASMATVVRPFEFRGIVFPETQLEDVKRLRVVPIFDNLVPTSTEGLRLSLSQFSVDALAEIERAKEEEEKRNAGREVAYKVIKESDEGMEEWGDLEPVLVDYAKKLKKHINVVNFHGTKSWDHLQPPDGMVRIIFWAGVDGGEARSYGSVLGIRLSDGQHDGVRVYGGMADFDILSGEEVIAQVVGSTLLVAFDLPHGLNAGKLMGKILDEYMKLDMTKKNKPEVDIEAKVKSMNLLLTGALDRSIADTKAAMDKKFTEINSYTTAVTGLLAAATSLRSTLEALKDKKARNSSIGESVIRGLMEMEHVKNVTITADIVVVDTDHMDFTYKGNLYKGHAYRICMSPGRGSLTIVRGDMIETIQGYVHPHVATNGIPCLGNIKKGAYDFLTGFEFVPLADLIIQYLQVANDTDWYVDPVKWPKVKVEKERKEESAVPAASEVVAAAGDVVSLAATATTEAEPLDASNNGNGQMPERTTEHYCVSCDNNVEDDGWCSGCEHCTDCCICELDDLGYEDDEEEEDTF